MSGSRESLNKLTKNHQQLLGPSPPHPLLALSTWRPSRRPISRQSLAGVMKNRRTEWRSRRRATSPLTRRAKSGAADSNCGLKLGAKNSLSGFNHCVISPKRTVLYSFGTTGFAFYRHARMEVERGFWHKRIQTTAIPELYD